MWLAESEDASCLATASAATNGIPSLPSVGFPVGLCFPSNGLSAGFTSLPPPPTGILTANGHQWHGFSLAVWLVLATSLYCVCSFLRRTFGKDSVSVTIPENDSHYYWLKQWLEKQEAASSNVLRVRARWLTIDEIQDRDPSSVKAAVRVLEFVPKLKGTHRHTFNGSKVRVAYEELPAELPRLRDKEQLVVQAPSTDLVSAFISGIKEEAVNRRKRTHTYRWNCHQKRWAYAGSSRARPLSSVVLDADVTELLDDVSRFSSSAQWYTDHGVPFRRGYLLHGPPGCGKTSLVCALAAELRREVFVMSLAASGMTDEMIHMAFSTTSGHLVVLEDVDAALPDVLPHSQLASSDPAPHSEGHTHSPQLLSGAASSSGSQLSLTGLLNALDGIAAGTGRMLVMTTNHVERLSPALLSPGRVDFRMKVDLASRNQIARLFRVFYPDASPALTSAFASKFEERIVSPAALQGYFLRYRESADDAVVHVNEFLSELKQDSKRS